ncbi:chloroplast envelope translocase family [Micractinium conductrix]|uniref:Protein TIC 20 n=1 Tax=Micractinium conductrix TaxID=554055 RepID=A0A2P6VFR8_9CHLO|nr:chloroplast envelope translocase family [Micractinium conductrix]|eukprot:PSC72911.1 chloroplast envelope translocase family [Micractinium conductrix]
MYAKFRNLLLIYFAPGPLAKIYFGSQFAPLIIFFVMFLSIVKNTKLHHFVRFNCMQAIMLDIVVMLFHILRAYLPAELKWSVIGHYFDMFGWTCCMATVLYAVFWTVRGYYADIPFVSESVYHQVQLSEPAAARQARQAATAASGGATAALAPGNATAELADAYNLLQGCQVYRVSTPEAPVDITTLWSEGERAVVMFARHMG